MTHKVNPSLFRLGINKKPVNFLYINNALNQKINQKSWLLILDFIKKTIKYSLKYVIIFDRTLKKEEDHKFRKEKFLKSRKKIKLIKYNPLKINRFDILNITFKNTTNNYMIPIDKKNTSENKSIIITTLNININLFDKYISNFFPAKKNYKSYNKKKLNLIKHKFLLHNNNKKWKNSLKKRKTKFIKYYKPKKTYKRFNKKKTKAKEINWVATENYIINNLTYIFNSQLKKFTKNTLFKIYCDIKFATTPNLSATLELEKIKKELEALKPLRIPQIFKKTLFRSKKKRSRLFKTTKSLGIKIRLTGRFNGAERSRSKIFERGRVTIKSYNSVLNYDYGFAKTKYGVIGIKIWVDQGQSILWKNNTQSLSILKKNIIIKKISKYNKRKRYKKIKFKKYNQLKYLTNFYCDIYQYEEEQ
uniref:ribosomal protein S3 n=1 Tax=Prototheca cookei TaxID=2509259 RepID=UPI003001E7E9